MYVTANQSLQSARDEQGEHIGLMKFLPEVNKQISVSLHDLIIVKYIVSIKFLEKLK